TAVDLDDQPGLVADKIGNVVADRHLAAELVPLHLLRAQYLPDSPFRLGHALPQSASSRAGTVDGMLLHLSIRPAGNITPSQPSPLEGEGARRGTVLDQNSWATVNPAASRCRRSGPRSGRGRCRPSPP